MERFDVAIIGAGFAGTILARIVHRLGLRVVLLDRSRHPRFAIGESSTPLAAICLERLAKRFDMPDLGYLAAYGRWLEHFPATRRGLKRGFTFYHHRPHARFANSDRNENRLLVAASPDEAVADSHWLREDVDYLLVQRAVAEGVDYRDQAVIEHLEPATGDGWRLVGRRDLRSFELGSQVLIDGSGAGRFLAQELPIPSALKRVDIDTALVFGHFSNVGSFGEIAQSGGADMSPGPYPDDQAAIHHLLEEGWMYVLPFDHKVVSAGVLMKRQEAELMGVAAGVDPAEIWHRLIGRYPSLAQQFAAAEPIRPLGIVPRVQRRLRQAAGENWALLPHTFAFVDPMYSTGIAWSLIAVERLALLFEEAAHGDGIAGMLRDGGLDRYGRLVASEARQISALVQGAYLAMNDFDLFTAQSFLYFATASFEEVDQRLHPEGREGIPAAWRGFLGGGEAKLESIFSESVGRLRSIASHGEGVDSSAERQAWIDWVTAAIKHRNVTGLADPTRHNLYPVDLELLVDRAGLLGLTKAEMRANLHLLRGS